MALPPVISPEARAAALQKAAEARRIRSELKTKLKMGSVSIRDVLVSTDEVVLKTKILTILESLPKLGKVKARRLMDEVGIADTRRVQGLGEQQKLRLLEALDGASS